MPIKPKPLRRGDTVAVVAPAGAFEVDRSDRGCALLDAWDLKVRRPRRHTPVRYLAGTDDERATELREALADDRVDGVLVARGGFGATRLFDSLRLGPVRGRPKPLVGFSDATVLLTRLVQEAGWVAFHGPMVAADLPDLAADARDRFRRFLFDEAGWWSGAGRECWRAGHASGTLIGGCLSLLVATLGTPYELRVEAPTVLFLEDVNEKPYRIERMLVQLRDAGKLDGVSALVIGSLVECDEGEPNLLRDIFDDVLRGHRFPVLFGIEAGHDTDNVVLPFGCGVHVDADARVVQLKESPFEARA